MRVRPSGESGPPVAMIVRRWARFGRRRARWKAASARVCAGATRTVAASSAAVASSVGGGGGREDDGGAFQQRGEPGPGRAADDQQPVVRPEVGVQQQVGQRADQQGGRPEAGERRQFVGSGFVPAAPPPNPLPQGEGERVQRSPSPCGRGLGAGPRSIRCN